MWARIGLLSFGGPAGQIALMHRILVEEKRWIGEARFLHALNYCMLLPGPEAQQLATYIGWLLHRTAGGVVAGTLFVLPGLVVITALSAVYAVFQGTTALDTLFFGLKAAVLAIVVEAVLKLGRRALRSRFMIAVAATAFVLIFALGVPFPAIVATAALTGIVAARLRPELVARPFGQDLADAGAADAVLDASAEHTRPAPRRASRVLLVWGSLWALLPLAFHVALGGVYPTLAAFFAQTAVVTFGGAYAVLAYVGQAAVETYGWLRPAEMLDGLAMAETTPGPLIMVLSFVGFMAAFREPGGLDPLLAGILGSLLTAWVSFVPSFLWIFLGAPYVEALRQNRTLHAALATVTAAVVGVILNLAVWFGLHVVFREVRQLEAGPLDMPVPILASLDPSALLLAIGAAVALFYFELGMLRTLVLGAAAGVALRLLA